eukprot:Hpha_TRINITY_DN34152_c0_g1::TRINITY_DN34152_c0_g1_i2::g.75928::m.75928
MSEERLVPQKPSSPQQKRRPLCATTLRIHETFHSVPPGSPEAENKVPFNSAQWWSGRWPGVDAPVYTSEVGEVESLTTEDRGRRPEFPSHRPPCSAKESRAKPAGPPTAPILRRDDLTKKLVLERRRREVQVLLELLVKTEETRVEREMSYSPTYQRQQTTLSAQHTTVLTPRQQTLSVAPLLISPRQVSEFPATRVGAVLPARLDEEELTRSMSHMTASTSSPTVRTPERPGMRGKGPMSPGGRARETRCGMLATAMVQTREVTLPDTRLMWPLVPMDPVRVRLDVKFALCRFFSAEGWCRRGVRCSALHSTNPVKENFRRMIMKVRARVAWARGSSLNALMSVAIAIIPLPNPFEWPDPQMRRMPEWIIQLPHTQDTKGGLRPSTQWLQFFSDLTAELMKNGRHLLGFELRKCPLPTNCMHRLLACLRKCSHLRRLRLAFADLDDMSAELLSEFLDHHGTLETLELHYNNIGSKGVAAMCRGAANCRSIRHLSLHGNPIGDEGGAVLGQFLSQASGASRLRSLEISSTMMGDTGIVAISRGLRESRSLTKLSIDGTFPTMVGCLSLFESLKKNTSLLELSQRFNRATTDRFVENCKELLLRNKILKAGGAGVINPGGDGGKGEKVAAAAAFGPRGGRRMFGAKLQPESPKAIQRVFWGNRSLGPRRAPSVEPSSTESSVIFMCASSTGNSPQPRMPTFKDSSASRTRPASPSALL